MPRSLAIALLLIILLLLLLGGAAFAQSPPQTGQQPACARITDLDEQLREKYGEAPNGYGLQPNGNVLMLYSAPRGSWTIVEVTPEGVGCIRATGHGWESLTIQRPSALGERGA